MYSTSKKNLPTTSAVRSSGHQAYSVVATPTTMSVVPQVTEQKEKYRDGAKRKNIDGAKKGGGMDG
jgi:hypothetical protein